MSPTHENATILGVGVAACAACCAGPILGIVAGIGLGTVAGLALFGAVALLFGIIALAFVLGRRRRARAIAQTSYPVPVELTSS